jgi:hypothetical protein
LLTVAIGVACLENRMDSIRLEISRRTALLTSAAIAAKY